MAASQEAIDCYISTPDHELPEGFSRSEDGKAYANGFAFDKALEILTTHPGYWPIVVEFTHGRLAFTMGTLLVDSQQVKPLHLHCSREDFRWQSTRYDTREGRIFCDDFAIFVYFDDVFPGDGGLLVVPGSHKAAFARPAGLFNSGLTANWEDLPFGVVNVTPRAGDIIVISELLCHGALQWQPEERLRRSLVLRYRPQFKRPPSVPEVLHDRLSPPTRELMAYAHYNHSKTSSKRARCSSLGRRNRIKYRTPLRRIYTSCPVPT